MATAIIGQLRGLNQDSQLDGTYLSEAKNIFCLADGGFSTLKGRAKFIDANMGAGTYLYEATWPDGHKSIIVRAGRNLYAIEAGVVTRINNPLPNVETCSTKLSHPTADSFITNWNNAQHWMAIADVHTPHGTISDLDIETVDKWYSTGQITKDEWDMAHDANTFTEVYGLGSTWQDFLDAWLPPELTIRELCEMFEGQADHIDEQKVEKYYNCGLLTMAEYNRLIRDVANPGDGDNSISAYCDRLEKSQTVYDEWFSTNEMNPTHITSFSKSRYIVGANYRRDKAWYWDGRLDRPIQEISTEGAAYRVVESFAGRLWGLGREDFPMNLFYGDPDELNIHQGKFLTLRDNPRTSELVGMRTASRNVAYVWGDYGVWAIEYTGQYPLFAIPQLIHRDADCVSNNSIVQIPGVGFAWMGKEYPWLLSNGQVRRIDLGPNREERIKGLLAERSLVDLYRVSGFYDENRKAVVWSFPTKQCDVGHPYRDPKSIAWDWALDAWTELTMGFEGSCEVDYLGKRERLVTDQDGYIYLYDYKENSDKGGDAVEWEAVTMWLGSGYQSARWDKMRLTRPNEGADKVYVSVYDEQQVSPVNTGQAYFSVAETLDVPASSSDGDFDHPSYDPGGPNDLGLPPNPLVDLEAPVSIVGRYVKIKLWNDGTAGPDIPMRKLEVDFQPLK